MTPPGTASALPGTLLKVEQAIKTSGFTIPLTIAMSRIVFRTRTLDGASVPASAFVMWPYSTRKQPDGGIPVNSWSHGTTDIFGDQAPAHLHTLSYQLGRHFTMALQGYAIVAPDYTGLGITSLADGAKTVHKYFADLSHANDLIFSVQSAQTTFS